MREMVDHLLTKVMTAIRRAQLYIQVCKVSKSIDLFFKSCKAFPQPAALPLGLGQFQIGQNVYLELR